MRNSVRANRRIETLLGAVILTAAAALAQVPTVPAMPPGGGAKLNVELDSKLDSKKAKVGDVVNARLASDWKQDGATVLAKGSKLAGRITLDEAAADRNAAARLGVLFYQATTKQGKVVPLRAAIIHIVVDANNSNTSVGMINRPTEMGGSGVNLPMQAEDRNYADLERASNGAPISFSLQEMAPTDGSADLGGVIASPEGNLELDSGVHVTVEVLKSN